MKKDSIKTKAFALRRQGESINTIAKKLSISKSTASVWCRDITLSDSQLKALSEKSNSRAISGLLHASEKKRSERIIATEREIHKGKKDVGRLSTRDIFMVGLGLYWGEGYKKGSQELGFTNSDPELILFYMQWLNRIYNIKPDFLILRVSINMQHKERIEDVEQYWSNLTQIPLSQFTKSSLIKTTSKRVYANNVPHYRTLRIKVRKGTALRRRILGSIEGLYVTPPQIRGRRARSA